MTSRKNRLRRMLLLDKMEPLVGQTPKVADFRSESASGPQGQEEQKCMLISEF